MNGKLKEKRKERGLTLVQLSKLSGVSVAHIARVERGERSPGSVVLNKIEKVLGSVRHQGETLEELYGLGRKEVELKRVQTVSGRWLELFKSPGNIKVEIEFPEFTCKCPRTSQPDFAMITLKYIPGEWCVELKSLKYFLNSFRDEGHFHEEVCVIIEGDLREALKPEKLSIIGEFNVRGGTYPKVIVGDDLNERR